MPNQWCNAAQERETEAYTQETLFSICYSEFLKKMGKPKTWIIKLFKGKKDKEKNPSGQAHSLTDHSDIIIISAAVHNHAPPPDIHAPPPHILKETRGWSCRRSNSRVTAVPPRADYVVPAALIEQLVAEEAAAVTIQSAFRSYLARKALKALKGLVKVQALVRGYLVRKRTTSALRCIQSLLTAQARARSQRIRMADESNSIYQIQSSHQERDCKGVDDNIKIVEMDDAGQIKRSKSSRKCLSGHPQTAQTNHGSPKRSTANSTYSKQEQRDLPVKPSTALVDPSPGPRSSPSAFVDSCPRADDYRFEKALGSPRVSSMTSKPENPSYDGNMMVPSYMENTEASKAKLVRSRSAPRTGAGSNLSRKKPPLQAGAKPDSVVDPWLAKLARVGGSGKKREYGSSPSRTGQTNAVYGSSPSRTGHANTVWNYGSSPSRTVREHGSSPSHTAHINVVNGKSRSEKWHH